jgi:hypothetical protein
MLQQPENIKFILFTNEDNEVVRVLVGDENTEINSDSFDVVTNHLIGPGAKYDADLDAYYYEPVNPDWVLDKVENKFVVWKSPVT